MENNSMTSPDPSDTPNTPQKTQSAASNQTARVQAPKRKIGSRIIGGVALLILCAGAGLTGAWAYGTFIRPNTSSQLLQSGVDGNTIVSEQERNVSQVAAKVSPSVVSVITQANTVSASGRQLAQEGAGTGIIVTDDGYIMTNKHVIDGATTVSVVTNDGDTYEAKIVGSDPLNDVAFLKVKPNKSLTAATLGDSSSIRIGQEVVAIGNSLGQYQNTVTNGIISGTGRPVTAQSGSTVENLTDLLQTDAAINPGNSGGPLVNIAGQVIGINTAVAEDAQGIGFAIPINATKGILKSVVESGSIKRAYLGVNYVGITPEVASEYTLSQKQGAYVFSERGSAVVADGPAAKAGIREKDIITKINGKLVGPQGGVASLVGEYAPGDTIAVTVVRSGQELTLNITLGTYRN